MFVLLHLQAGSLPWQVLICPAAKLSVLVHLHAGSVPVQVLFPAASALCAVLLHLARRLNACASALLRCKSAVCCVAVPAGMLTACAIAPLRCINAVCCVAAPAGMLTACVQVLFCAASALCAMLLHPACRLNACASALLRCISTASLLLPLQAGSLPVQVTMSAKSALCAVLLHLQAGSMHAQVLFCAASALCAVLLHLARRLTACASALLRCISAVCCVAVPAGMLTACVQVLFCAASALRAMLLPLQACLMHAQVLFYAASALRAALLPLQAASLPVQVAISAKSALCAVLLHLQAGLLPVCKCSSALHQHCLCCSTCRQTHCLCKCSSALHQHCVCVAAPAGSLPVQVPTRKSWGSKEVRVRPLTANPNLSPPSATPSPSLPTSKSSCPPTPIAPAAPAAAAAAAAAASTASNPQAAAPSQSIDAAQPHAHITPFASATPTMPWPSAPLACAPTPITGSAGFAPVHHVACGRQGVGEVGERHTVAVGDQGSPPSSVARGARAPSDEKHIRVCHEGPPGTHSSNSNDNPSSNGRSSSESSSGDSGGEGGRGWGAKGGGLAAGKRGSDGGVGGGGGWGTRVGGRRDAPASAPGPRGMLGLALHQQQQQERERARVLRHYPAHAGQQQQHQVQQHFQQHLLVSGTGGPAGTAGQRDEDAVVGRGKGQACVRTHGVASESPCRWASSGNTPWDGNPEAEGNGGDEGDDGHADGVAADDLEADTIVCGGFDGIPAHPAVGAEAAAGSEEGYAPRHGPQRPHVPANPTRPRRDPTSPRAAAAGTQPGVSQLESVGRPSLMPPLPPPSGAVAIHTTPATSAFHIRAHAHAHPHTHAHAQRVSSRGRSGSSRHSSGSYSRGGSSSAVAGMSLEREGGGVGEAEGVVSAGAVGGVFGLYTPGSSRRVSGDLMSSALPSPSFPLSCSPQLPFAFTPASQSVAGSLMKHALLGGTPPSAGSLPWHIHTPPTGRHPYSTRGALLKSSSRGRDPAPQPAEKGTTTAAAWEMGHRGGEEDSKSSSAGGDPGGAGSIVRARDVSLLALVRRPSWVEHSLRTRAGAGHGHADPITGSGGDNSISKCGEAAVHRSLSLGSVGDRTGVHAHAHAYAVQPRSPWGDGRQHTRDRAGVNLPLRPSYALPSYPSSFDRMPLLQLPSSFSSGPSSPFAGLGFPHGCSFTQHPNFLLPSHHLPALTGAPGSHASAAAAAAGAPTQPVCSYYHLPRVGPADQQQHQQQLLLMDVPGRSITHHGDASSPAGRCGVGRSSSGGGGFAADRQDSLEHTDSECPHFCCIMPPRANGISPASSPHLLHFPPSPNNLASRGFAYHPPLLQYWPQQQQPQHWLPLPAPGTGSTQPHSAEASVDADGRPHAENATAPDASTNAAAALQTRALLHHHQHQQQLGADCAVQDTRLFCGGAAAASLPAPLNLMHVLRETAAPSSPSAPQGYHATNPGDPGSQSTPLLLGLEGPSPLSPRRQQHEQQQEDGGGCGPGIAAFEPLLPFELDVRDWVGDTHKAEPACQQPHSIWQQRQQQQQTMLGGVGWWLTHGDRPEAQDRPGACGDNWDVGATEGATYNGSLHGVEHLAALLLKREHGACVGAFMEMLDMQGAQPLGPLVAPFPTHTLGERVPPELQLHTAGHSTASQPSHTAAKGSEHGGLGDEGSMSFKGDTPRSGSVCVGDALTEVAKLQEKLKALVKQSP
ncbi:hypothetical protein DUNSADRAFT_7863 [Dunaliella salina]|uniref:Uncharacterized protein n=1 Tax=Dunaliella salina TaxID=3046 RepID=A0ABQ7GGA6_DUNSA|nr:hypothetical protein DUNSADRAFT_7863 [Dunaliella salina]|eukprot:KAF5835104.1 hypothetical protein DUNSADRAFT_7863 [Dunaliella salina]